MRREITKPIVFIVEDNDAYRVLTGRMLEQRGFLVLLFSDGFKALEMLEYIIPNIILSDIEMPGMDGFTLHEKIEDLYPNIKVPFQYLSSTTEKSVIDRANSLSIEQLVQKPAQPEELSKTLKRAISKFAAA
ncbi:MAG: response regulator [Balneola sp.]|nr:response regulator [Balneola sp.]MBO6651601.1 response regulator [Balneola sp.]MBO6710733.1 response regulator [Balneola sp.]MBO6799419.1 response regulator [Balneola sp.]MBO6869452.1 response regulator [Balneola sp.]